MDAGFKFCRVVPCEAFLNLATVVINHLEDGDQAKGGHSWSPGINDNGWRLKYVFFPFLFNSASMSCYLMVVLSVEWPTSEENQNSVVLNPILLNTINF